MLRRCGITKKKHKPGSGFPLEASPEKERPCCPKLPELKSFDFVLEFLEDSFPQAVETWNKGFEI